MSPGEPGEGSRATELLSGAHHAYRFYPVPASADALARGQIRPSEWVLLAYFTYVAVLSLLRGASTTPVHPALVGLVIGLGVFLLGKADRNSPTRFWNMIRDWVPAALILVAYWSVDWCGPSGTGPTLQSRLIGWDRTILEDWKLHQGIEAAGAWLPALLELAYLLLYAVPPLAIAVFYLYRERKRVDRFLFPFLLGTFAAYALLPHFPSDSPRSAYPQELLPGMDSIFRQFNIWILSHSDIHASVFPSGHVAVGFSAAFGMLFAFPEKKWIGGILMALATLVWMNTIYGRYHYAADGLASLTGSLAAAAIATVLYPHILRATGRTS